jgi:hypothetical protein
VSVIGLNQGLRSSAPRRHHSQQKQQRDTSRPDAGYDDRHDANGRLFCVEVHRSFSRSKTQYNNAMRTSLVATVLATPAPHEEK